ncbi:MAG TPA: GtrA family protein [Solirubrobacteraceae bacterium]
MRAPTLHPWLHTTRVRLLLAKAGLVGQGLRFAVAGATVSLVYIATTTVLSVVVGMPFQAALLIGYGLALSIHFTLQRLFVWAHQERFALPLHRQLGWYLLAAAAQYGATALCTLLLPSVLGLSSETVYLLVVLPLTLTNFLLFRYVIFHPRASPADAGLLCAACEE